jgi:glycosyltransferase involved in cell wall biosynthesis
MISAWSLLALNRRVNPQVLIVGTDPILSPVVSIVWKFLRPDVRLVHWCFDLYPEAAIADGVLAEKSLAARLFQWLMQRSYRSFDLIVDIGSCMRNRLLRYGSEATHATIVPWALSEPDSPAPIPASERSKLFGNAKLGLLYAGSIGRAHTWRGILELAEILLPTGGRVVFSVRGNAVEQLRRAVDASKAPLGFADFVGAERLHARLSAADVHIVTLRDEWTGTVVPSKFFGALAMGRPVLFAGSADSVIYKWVKEMGVGWILDPERVESLAIELTQWSESPEAKERLFQHCHSVYHREFSRAQALERWNCALRSLVGD